MQVGVPGSACLERRRGIRGTGRAVAGGYVQAAVDRGLDVDDFAPRLSFFFNLHNDFLEEIAKLRAARRIWAKVMKERFGAKNPKSMLPKFYSVGT